MYLDFLKAQNTRIFEFVNLDIKIPAKQGIFNLLIFQKSTKKAKL